MKAPHLPSGIEDFAEMRTRVVGLEQIHLALADKTAFLPALVLTENQLSVFTRPIRFMKSSTLSMMARFLAIQGAANNRHLFEGMAISGREYDQFREQYQGKVPVIFFTLKNIQANTWEKAKEAFSDVIANLYEALPEVEASLNQRQKAKFQRVLNQQASDRELESSLADLATYLYTHYGCKVIILIDEYDTPLHQAYMYTDKDMRGDRNSYFAQMTRFLGGFLSQALKSHPHVEKGFMTGVLRTAFASLVSSLNNATVYSVLSPEFAEVFGFTEAEVLGFISQIEDIDVDERERLKGRLQRWYDGYYMGGSTVRLYNPWSIAQFFNALPASGSLAARAYWLQAGNSLALEEHLAPRFARIQSQLTELMLGKKVQVSVNERTTLTDLDNPHNDGAFWGLLLHSGFATALTPKHQRDNYYVCDITIPNYEVAGAYSLLLERHQEKQLADLDPGLENYKAMLDALINGNIDKFATRLQVYMEQAVSFHDIPKRSKKRRRQGERAEELADDIGIEGEREDVEKTREQVYHAFMLGLLSGLHSKYFQLSSNREAGYGRYDIVLMPSEADKHGLIFEFKATDVPEKLEQIAAEALQQIEEKRYAAALEARGVTFGLHIGIAFCGKRFHIAYRQMPYQAANQFSLPESPYSGSRSPDRSSMPGDLSLRSPSQDSLHLAATSKSSFFKSLPAQYSNATLGGQPVQFEVHATGGSGHCGFYALPIANDRGGAKKLLLDTKDDANIRALVAPEIRDAVLSQQLPRSFPNYAWYEEWRDEYFRITSDIDTVNTQAIAFLENRSVPLPVERTSENILSILERVVPQPDEYQQLLNLMQALATHEQNLHANTNTVVTYTNFIEHDVGGGGELSFYTDPNQTSVLDALAQLANLRVHVWQDDPQDASRVILVRDTGPANGTVTHLHHRPGLSTHFQLISLRPHLRPSTPVNSQSPLADQPGHQALPVDPDSGSGLLNRYYQ